jgi:hypothetical protein
MRPSRLLGRQSLTVTFAAVSRVLQMITLRIYRVAQSVGQRKVGYQ